MGRPTVDLPVILGAIVLQQVFDLTDRETSDAIAYDIRWHYALDIRSDADFEITDRTLRNYRKLVMERELDEVIFRDVTDGLIGALGLDTSKQRMDSTGFKSAMRELTRHETFVETIGKFLRELKRKAPEEYDRVDPEVARRYVEREGDGCFGLRPMESRDRYPEVMALLLSLIEMFRGGEVEGLNSFGLMNRLFDEQCAIEEDGNLRLKTTDEAGYDRMNNPSDPDATYSGYKGLGYTGQLMETYTEEAHGEKTAPGIITYVALNKMTERDSQALKPALDEVEERGLKPEKLLADTAYGAEANRDDASRRGVELIAPSCSPKYYREGRFSIEHFELDENGFVVKCPAGYAPKTVNAMKKQLDANFEKSICAACELRERCPCGIQASKGKSPRLWYRYTRIKRRNRLLNEQTDEFREKYKWRSGMEGTISRLKNWMKLGTLRVRGRPAVRLALLLKALGMNILNSVAYLIS